MVIVGQKEVIRGVFVNLTGVRRLYLECQLTMVHLWGISALTSLKLQQVLADLSRFAYNNPVDIVFIPELQSDWLNNAQI